MVIQIIAEKISKLPKVDKTLEKYETMKTNDQRFRNDDRPLAVFLVHIRYYYYSSPSKNMLIYVRWNTLCIYWLIVSQSLDKG